MDGNKKCVRKNIFRMNDKLFLDLGDKECKRLFNKYYNMVFGWCINKYVTVQRDDIEEVLSEAFVKTFKSSIGDYPYDEYFKNLLFKIAKNEVYSFFTKNARRSRAVVSHMDEITDNLYPDGIYTEPIVINNDVKEAANKKKNIKRKLNRHIKQLPLQCRTIFTMLLVDGKTTKEVAEELNISTQTVLNQKARAIYLIKGMLIKKRK